MEKEIVVNVRRGIHGRVATKLVQIAQQNDVQLHIVQETGIIDCSSVLDVLSMGFVFGSSILFRVQGEKAAQAIAAVENLFSTRKEM